MNRILEKTEKNQVLLGDGAWGTFLQASGLQPGDCPELWNISHPEQVLAIARSYIGAGSDMIETNSFGSSSIKLAHYGLAGKAKEINIAAASISRKAAGADRIVVGSIGPTGKILMMGELTEDEMYHSFREQAQGLEQGGADALIIETMSDLSEALIATKAAMENTHCEIMVSFTFSRTMNNEFRTMMGISPTEAARTMAETGIRIVGSNCGNGIQDMIPVAAEIRQACPDVKIIIQPNAGQPIYKNGTTMFPDSPSDMIQWLPDLLQNGVWIFGGCCGTTPDHIRSFRKFIDGTSI
jgi:5-methyltetrahydrofolate--homocysteine methyltransferase